MSEIFVDYLIGSFTIGVKFSIHLFWLRGIKLKLLVNCLESGYIGAIYKLIIKVNCFDLRF